MAKYPLFIGLALLGLVGCQQQGVYVQTVPPPTFNGPVIASAPPVVVRPWKPPGPDIPQVQPRPLPAGVEKAWVPAAPARDWWWIVIHHSDSPTGSAADFDRYHRSKGWDELGYHFVIGNGSHSGNGLVEVGSRWPKQKYGAHCKTPDNQYNDHGIGICLVGNFEGDQPTAQQMAALEKLVGYLMKTYRIPADHVVGHRDCKSTDCPGRNLYARLPEIRRAAAKMWSLAEPVEFAPGDELMHDVAH